MKEHPTSFDAVMGSEATATAIEQLRAQFERGEIRCAALRVFKSDGTWEDVVLGGTETDRATVLAELQYKLDKTN